MDRQRRFDLAMTLLGLALVLAMIVGAICVSR
jgi:hypothetical protein